MQTVTKTYNVYSFDELSEKAKQKAINDYMNDESYFWGNDAIKSIEALAYKFNAQLKDYSIDWLVKCRSSWSFDVPYDMDEDELKRIINSLGEYNKETLKGLGECVLTGTCFDEDAIDGLRKAYFKGERDINELLMSAMNSLYDACQYDYEQQWTEEYFSEFAEANGYQFLENGELY